MSTPAINSTRNILKVSELVSAARKLLEDSFDTLWVEGEIGNFSTPKSGHWYFTLKDQNAQVKCVMFRGANSKLRFIPEEGLLVLMKCDVSLYEPRGDFQLIGKSMEVAGDGALQLAFQQLYTKLNDEGLFASERKRPLPEMVRHIGIITSPHGAAVHDMLNVLARRWPYAQVSLFPVTVQGDAAAGEIIDALRKAQRYNEQSQHSDTLMLEVLIVARGGGAMEDLHAFNDEALTRAIIASPIVVVTGIGHEPDVTIAQLAADVAASTPTAAAELVSPNQEEVLSNLEQLKLRFGLAISNHINTAKQLVQQQQARLQSPERKLQQYQQRLDDLQARAQRAILNSLNRWRGVLKLSTITLAAPRLLDRVNSLKVRLGFHTKQLQLNGSQLVRARTSHLYQLISKLESLSPLAVIKRGFTMLRTGSEVVTSVTQLNIGQTIEGHLKDGTLTAEVKGITPSQSTVSGKDDQKL